MRLYGLTGGIASGKSTVAKILREGGTSVIDADLLARELVEPGTPLHAELRRRWPDCFGADGRLDRKALGARVFADPEQRQQLDALLHPAIQQEALRRTAALAAAGQRFAFYEAALIFENGLDAGLDGVLLVACKPETQLARLRARDGLSEEEARRRLAAQLPVDEKRRRARWIVYTDRPLAQTHAEVEAIQRLVEEES